MILLTTNMQGFAHGEINSVGLQRTLGGHELVVGVHLRTVTPDAPQWATLFSATVQVAGSQGAFTRLGEARPGMPVRIVTRSNSLASTAEFRLPLNASQIAAIEELRDAGDLQVKLVISGEGGPVSAPERNDPAHNELITRVPQSTWIQALNAAGAMDVLLLEVSMPVAEPSPPQRDMMAALRAAQRLFVEGNFSESVARCRTALEAMAVLSARGQGWAGPAFEALKEKRPEMTKDQRELVVEAALLHFTHLGAHPNEVDMSRRDAKLALSLTASVLAYRAS